MSYKYTGFGNTSIPECNFCIGGCKCGKVVPGKVAPVNWSVWTWSAKPLTITANSTNLISGPQNYIKDNKLTLTLPGAESFDIRMEGAELLLVDVHYEDEDKNQKFEITVPKKYLGAAPEAVYRRGILTLTWEEPERVKVEVEFQE